MISDKELLKEYASQIIKNSLNCVCTSDTDGNIVVYNPAAARSFGYTKEDVLKKGTAIIFASQEEYDRIQTILGKDGSYKGEVLNRRKNGEVFTSFLTANTIFNDQGEVIGTMGVSRDITEELENKKVLEEQLDKNNILIKKIKQLSEIATSVTNGICETNKDGEIRWCNESFERITGFSLDEFKNNTLSNTLSIPHFYEETYKKLKEDTPHFQEPVQLVFYRKNGNLLWMLMEATPIYNEKNELIKIIEVYTENTDLKKAELALRDSERYFQEISKTIEGAFYLYNIEEKKYEYISPNCESILGATQEFFYSGKKHTTNYVFPADKETVFAADKQVRTGKPYNIEFRMMIDGKIKWIRERSNPILDKEGNVVKISGICTDITEVKKNSYIIERQSQSINDSLVYAKHIQEATLPSEEDIGELFPDNFVLYHPKSEISGDFYLVDRAITNEGEDLDILTVADCTGHGVPGGILSILCNRLLKQSMTEHSVNSPGEALSWVKNELEKFFASSSSRVIKDGMDVGMCVFDRKADTLTFAGANHNCVVIRNKELTILKGDRQHVGYTEGTNSFTNHTFNMQEGDVVFLSTDGIMDQFGGNKDKKFLRKKFYQLIQEYSNKRLKQQKKLIQKTWEEWKGDNEQTDDICVLAIRYHTKKS